jgi:hypothetical protein
MIGM